MYSIPLHKPVVPERAHDYIRQVFASEHLAADGPFSQACERWLEQHLGTQRALVTTSASTALEIAALVLDLQPGDEVIMPAWNFPSAANAFALRGAVPVFVDIRGDTLNLDEQQIEAAITDRTRGILVMHYAGLACEMGRIMTIAHAHGVRVIEDAAQAFMGRYGDCYLGTMGDLGVLSFQQTKSTTCGEGGALLVNNPQLITGAEILRDKGTNRQAWLRGEVDRYQWSGLGIGAAPPEITAAVLLAQLEQTPADAAARRRAWNHYAERLQPLTPPLSLPPYPPPHELNGSLYAVRPGTAAEAARIRHSLEQQGIQAHPHYTTPLHATETGARIGRQPAPLPVTETTSQTLLRLPIWQDIDSETQDRVIATLTDSVSTGA